MLISIGRLRRRRVQFSAAVRNRAVVPGSILHSAARESNKAFTLYSIKPIQEKAMRRKKCL